MKTTASSSFPPAKRRLAKKTIRLLAACLCAVCLVAGIAYWSNHRPKSSKVKPSASKRAQTQTLKELLAASASQSDDALDKEAKAKAAFSKQQIEKIGQSFHARREKALRAKDTNALVALGREALKAASFPGSKKLAAMCFMDAAKLGNAEGMWLAGWCHEKGVGVDSGAKRAFNYYFEAGEAGLPDGYTAAARMLLAGNTNLGDMDTAVSLVDKALDMGGLDAKFLKGTILLADGGDVQAALDYLTEAAHADYPDAQRLLGQLYKEGKYVPKDMDAAAEWAKYAADAGLPSANTDYAKLSLSNDSSIVGASTDAIDRLIQAANQNNADAAYEIAALYRSAPDVSIRDVEKIRNYATTAFENGRGDAAFLMASTYFPADNDDILKWLKKGQQSDDWRSRYAGQLIENENVAPYDAVRLAMKATIEDAMSYGLATNKNAPAASTPPEVVSMVKPAMPAALSSIDLDTVVKVRFVVNEDGVPTNLQVTSPSPYVELDKAAKDAVAQWRYKPAIRDGVIAPVQITAPIRFRSNR